MSTDTTALVTIDQNAALATFGDGVSNDFMYKPSGLELVQPISPAAVNDGARPGRFRDKQANMEFETMQIVALDFDCGRVLFPPGGELGADPICRSSNGVTPDDSDRIVRQADKCANCDHASWAHYNRKTKEGAPDCKEKITLLLAERDSGFLYRLNVGGMSLKPLKDFRDTLYKLSGMTRGKVPWRAFSAEMGTTKIVGKKGTYFVLKFSNPKALNPADVQEFATKYATYKSRRGRFAEEAAGGAPVDAVAESVQEYVAA